MVGKVNGMERIFRGTTPTLNFEGFPFKLSQLSAGECTIGQYGRPVIVKSILDGNVEDNCLNITLTQTETLRLRAGANTDVQIRGRTAGGYAFASEHFALDIEDVIKDGEI